MTQTTVEQEMVQVPPVVDRKGTPEPSVSVADRTAEIDTVPSESTSTKMTPWRLFNVEMTPDTAAIASVYFVQGVLGLARLAVSYFFKDDLQLGPAEVTFLMSLSTIPWLIKPIYGFISDTIPLFGYRRRSYLILCGIIGALSWLYLATLSDSKYTAAICITLSSLSVAVSDVVVDSMVVERARGESVGMQGALQSLCWGSSAIGGIASAYFSGSLVQTYGPRVVFGITSILPLITSFAGLLVQEKKAYLNSADQFDAIPQENEPHDNSWSDTDSNKSAMSNQSNETLEKIKINGSPTERAIEIQPKRTSFHNSLFYVAINQVKYLWETIKQPSILLPTVFIFVWQASPQSDTAMFYFTVNKLHFDPEFLGRVRLITAIASLFGVWVFNSFLKEVPLRKLFFWVTIIGTTIGLSQLMLVTGLNRDLGISDKFFALGDSLVLTVLGQVSFMPILVLAARLCPEGVEATLFATLMSICNLAGFSGGILGASLTDAMGITSTEFKNLWILVLVCNLSSLVSLPFLYLLPPSSDVADSSGVHLKDVDEENPNQHKQV